MLEFRPVAPELTVVDIENAVGTRLMLVQLGLAPPLEVNARYRLVQMLGRGARGLVCLASDLHLRREVALKIYPAYGPGPVSDEVASEAQALARLKHPNIVAVYDFGHGELRLDGETLSESTHSPVVPCFFMSMEYVRGQSLRRWLASGQRSHDQLLAVFAHAGEGLSHAHDSGVAHRDFKPDNVMVSDEGRIMVVDFGLAARRRSLPETARTTALTLWQPPRIVGTLEYMAPEAHFGKASSASDQYSFAVSLHEALIGALPPTNPAGIAAIEQHRFPGAVARVLTRALAPNPLFRYPSMRELLVELPRRWDDQWRWTTLEDEPAPARTPPWAALAVGGVLLLGAVSFGAGAHLFGASEDPERDDEPSSSENPGGSASARELADAAESATRPGDAGQPGPDGLPIVEPSRHQLVRDADCDAFVGSWQLESVDLWGFEVERRFERGFHELVVERDDPGSCRLHATLRKTGTSRQTYDSGPFVGYAPVSFDHHDDGTWITGEWVVCQGGQSRCKGNRRQTLRFELAVTDSGLRGSYERLTRSPDKRMRRSMIGVASAARERRGFTPAASLAAAPCRSQCTIMCAGAQAAAQCSELCEPSAQVHECGPPSADFVDPYTTQRNIEKYRQGQGEWVPAGYGQPCDELLDIFADSWTVHERLDSGAVRTWLVELRAHGCELRGEALDFPARHQLVGEIDSKGQWMLRDADDPSALLWSLQGWEFAVGTAGGDAPGRLSAYKRR